MSLALIQGYSSAEEGEEKADIDHLELHNSSDDDDDNPNISDYASKPLFDLPKPSSSSDGGSSLPSAFDAFSEVSRPPEFLNNCVEEPASAAGGVDDKQWRHGCPRNRKEKKNLPAGSVVEAKAQLVGIHERVRSDVDGNASVSSIQPNNSLSTAQGGKRMTTATNPNAEDAAELLRMCARCGIPKTYSNAKGMVCPVCGDRPPADTNSEPVKKKGSIIKEKEKSKRMKGQSSHATWKSETEMQLRQQFD